MTSLPSPLTADSIEEHARWLRRLTRSLVVQEDRADEVLQETLLVALQRQGHHVDLKRQWLARIARNFARRLPALEQRRRVVETDCRVSDLVPATYTVVETAEMQQLVGDAVLALDEPYRSTMLHRFLEQRSYGEVARRMSVPVETVRTRIKRGLKLLRAKLQREHGGPDGWAVPILGVTEFSRLAPVGGAVAPAFSPVVCSSIVLGSIFQVGIMSKWLVSAAVVLLAVLWWTFWPVTPQGDGARAGDGVAAELSADAGATETTGEQVTEQRETVAGETEPRPDSAPPTGSLVVHVVFDDDKSPAAGVRLNVKHSGDSDPVFGAQSPRTDARGTARIAGLQPGRVSVETDRDLVPRHHATITAGAESELTIVLKMGVNISGIVVNSVGIAVAGAGILIGHWAIGHRKLEPVTTTGSDGRFAIRAARVGHCVSAIASGYAPSFQYMLKGGKGSDVELRVVLTDAGGAVRGRVEGPDGAPVPGAVVRVGSEKPNMGVVALPDGSNGMHPFPVETRSASDGMFAIECLAAGDNPVTVRAKDLAPWTGTCSVVAHGVTPLVVRLSQGVICTGTVRDDTDQPMVRVVVQYGELATLAHVRTVTAADGTYRLAGLPTGQIALVADGGKRGKESTKVQAAAGETVRWDVRFTSGTKLTGRLLTKRGDPIAGQHVVIVASGGARMKVLGSVVTDNQGRFSLVRCPERVGILFRAKGFSPAHRMDVDPGAGEVVLRVEKFVLSVRIKGVVIDPSGKPVAAGVWPTRRGDGNSQRKPNDPGTGAFALGPLPPGVHRLMIEAQGLATYRSAERELAADETWDLGTIQLERGGRAKVVFDRSAVGDVEGLIVGVVDSDLRGLTNRRAGADVAYTEQLPAGNYHVVVRGKNIATLAIPVVLKTGEETELTVKLTRGSPFTVRFDTKADRVLVTITGPHGLVQKS